MGSSRRLFASADQTAKRDSPFGPTVIEYLKPRYSFIRAPPFPAHHVAALYATRPRTARERRGVMPRLLGRSSGPCTPHGVPGHEATSVKMLEHPVARPPDRHAQLRRSQRLFAGVTSSEHVGGVLNPRGAGAWGVAGFELLE